MHPAQVPAPGGPPALQGADADGLALHPPPPAWDRLVALLIGAFAGSGDPFAGRRVYRLLVDAGFGDVDFRVCHARARAGDAPNQAPPH